MNVICPRCRASIGPDAESCPHCGLTSSQVDQLLSVQRASREDRAAPAPVSPGPNRPADARVGTDVTTADDTPIYWSEPVYGQGPTHRRMGYSPVPPRVSDLRRPDTSVDLTGTEPRVLVPGTHASPKAPPAPAPPRLRQQARTNRRAELVLLALVAVIAGVMIFLFTIT
jgi:hypothetical protein